MCLLLWCSALLACIGQLERIFKDADNVVLSSLASSVQMTAGPGPATQAAQASPSAVGMFDDDLDLGAPVVAAAGAKRCSTSPEELPTCIALVVCVKITEFCSSGQRILESRHDKPRGCQ